MSSSSALAAAYVVLIALGFGWFADHIYTVWRDGFISLGHSQCDGCARALTWETTPVVGYLLTRGRCHCGLRVPLVYPAVESIGIVGGAAVAIFALRSETVPGILGITAVAFIAAYGVGAVVALILNKAMPPHDKTR